jgi:hypothetical protein
MKNNDESIEKWDEEKRILLENNEKWLNTIRSIESFPDNLNEQIKNLCVEVIKWHELSKQSYTLLSSLYENVMPLLSAIDGTLIDLKSNQYFDNLEDRFEKAKNNYTNNIKAKEDPNYRPDISI